MRIFASCMMLTKAPPIFQFADVHGSDQLCWQVVRTAAPDAAGWTGANLSLRN